MEISTTDPCAWLAGRAADGARIGLATPEGRRLTYADLHAESARFAAALAGAGVRQGERIALQAEKSVEAVLLYLGALRLGAVLVPLNTACTAAELEYFLADAQPRLAVVRPADRAVLEPPAERAGCAHLETLDARGAGSFMDRVRAAAPAPAAAPAQAHAQARPAFPADALAALVYTSGTTGRSKGAMLTRGNLASNAAALAAAWRFTADDVLLHALPLFHVHGLFVALNTVLAAGASLVLLPKFDAAQILELLPAASLYMGVPTHYTRLLQLPALSSAAAGMRLFVSGSAPLLAETHGEFLRRTGHRILERYGMTETLMNTSNPYDGERVPGSVGPPLPGIEVRVTGDSGVAQPGAIGMIEVRGPNVFAGYWRDPGKSAQSFTADGFFVTGDLGTLDASGYVRIVGRAKDLVISGGYNVYPKEIELALDQLPGILESAVIGLPHPDLGEGVTAVVVPRGDGAGGAAAESARLEAELIVALRERLARYKVPRRVLFVEELPRNAMGKVQKAALRAAYATLYQPRPTASVPPPV